MWRVQIYYRRLGRTYFPFAAGGARPAGDDEGGLARRERAAARGEGAGAAAGESARKSAAPERSTCGDPPSPSSARRLADSRSAADERGTSGEWPSVSLTAFFQNPAGAGAAAALGEPGPEGGAELAMPDIVAAESESSTASTIFGASPDAGERLADARAGVPGTGGGAAAGAAALVNGPGGVATAGGGVAARARADGRTYRRAFDGVELVDEMPEQLHCDPVSAASASAARRARIELRAAVARFEAVAAPPAESTDVRGDPALAITSSRRRRAVGATAGAPPRLAER